MSQVILIRSDREPLHPRLEALGRVLRASLGMCVWTGLVWGPVWFISNVPLSEGIFRTLTPALPFLQGWPPIAAAAVLAGLAGRGTLASPLVAIGLAFAAEWQGLTPISLGLLGASVVAGAALLFVAVRTRRMALKVTEL